MRTLTAKPTVIGLLLLLQACATYSPYYDSYTAVPTSSFYGNSTSKHGYSRPVSNYSYYESYGTGSPVGYNDYRVYPRNHYSRRNRNTSYHNTRANRNRLLHNRDKHYSALRSRKPLKQRQQNRKHRHSSYPNKQITHGNHPLHAISPENKYRHADQHLRKAYVKDGKQTHIRRRSKYGRNQQQIVKRHPRNRQYTNPNLPSESQSTDSKRTRSTFDRSQPNRSRTAKSVKPKNKNRQSARNHRQQLQADSRRLRLNQGNRHVVPQIDKSKYRIRRNSQREYPHN